MLQLHGINTDVDVVIATENMSLWLNVAITFKFSNQNMHSN